MSRFDEWFKKKFKDLHDCVLQGDLVAINYKKAIKKTYSHQQKRIDELQQENEQLKAELVALAGGGK